MKLVSLVGKVMYFMLRAAFSILLLDFLLFTSYFHSLVF